MANLNTSFETATGPIDYGFRNDYMFRAILQKSAKTLKGLVGSMLHLHPDEIQSVEITNPIILGENLDSKSFILDINVLLNNHTVINLEMQVNHLFNWTDRSLSYLCRSFDQLSKGQDYGDTKSVIHIGFLDFTPFPEIPEFYSTYRLLNVKNHHLYSDKFTLCVVDLTHIDLATDEDRAYGIDKWASLFKAISWEEIRMAAKNNEYLTEATKTLYTLNSDEMIRRQCQARRDAEWYEYLVNKKIESLTAELADKNAEIINKDAEIANKDAEIANRDAEIVNKDAEIAALKEKLASVKL